MSSNNSFYIYFKNVWETPQLLFELALLQAEPHLLLLWTPGELRLRDWDLVNDWPSCHITCDATVMGTPYRCPRLRQRPSTQLAPDGVQHSLDTLHDTARDLFLVCLAQQRRRKNALAISICLVFHVGPDVILHLLVHHVHSGYGQATKARLKVNVRK